MAMFLAFWRLHKKQYVAALHLLVAVLFFSILAYLLGYTTPASVPQFITDWRTWASDGMVALGTVISWVFTCWANDWCTHPDHRWHHFSWKMKCSDLSAQSNTKGLKQRTPR